MLKAKINNKHQSRTVAIAIKDVKQVKEKALNIMIPEKLHTKFKIKSASDNSNMKEELIRLISSYVDI